eukprot:TRINITY_DN2476_c0_g2_i2.p1 TRINITY_DN2476_c0_g2~~TRINITY_DN2476_c0_g2_i2.p1  ORF type:complete len:541 (-),score=111.38 TRINITY_DN2476_c0_g2_i2:144-1706(-)
MADASARLRFAFVFPAAAGHVNPSLPVARRLVKMGHAVHYLCREPMREVIESVGAIFHSDVAAERELFGGGRTPDILGAIESLADEHGLSGRSLFQTRCLLRTVQAELVLPGMLRWMRSVQPDAVVYCPVVSTEAAYAARILGIPSVAMLPLAGPGSLPRIFRDMMRTDNLTEQAFRDEVQSFAPNRQAVERLNSTYGLDIKGAVNLDPAGRMDVLKSSHVTLVTTITEFQDLVPDDVAQAYATDNVLFECVGPLLDDAAEATMPSAPEQRTRRTSADAEDVLEKVRAAKASGRRVVLVCMGTVLTSDNPSLGWHAGRSTDVRGQRHGLTGCQLCRAVWAAAFEAFGETTASEAPGSASPLLVLALGPQEEALGELTPPPNAICVDVVPQVSILQAGTDLFLTHGGQNSFTEGLASAVPLVVCPGFADQPLNAQRAEDLGVGLQVPRPDPPEGAEAEALAQYRKDIVDALRRVYSQPTFAEAAARCAERFRRAGGVPRAVDLVLEAASLKGGLGHTLGGA